jgi:hypothetical protein
MSVSSPSPSPAPSRSTRQTWASVLGRGRFEYQLLTLDQRKFARQCSRKDKNRAAWAHDGAVRLVELGLEGVDVGREGDCLYGGSVLARLSEYRTK